MILSFISQNMYTVFFFLSDNWEIASVRLCKVFKNFPRCDLFVRLLFLDFTMQLLCTKLGLAQGAE